MQNHVFSSETSSETWCISQRNLVHFAKQHCAFCKTEKHKTVASRITISEIYEYVIKLINYYVIRYVLKLITL